MTEYLFIYITHSSKPNAESICMKLLEENIIACANIYPISSMYKWKGEIVNENEWVSIVKSTKQNWSKLKARVLELHPYDTPCISCLRAEANESYLKWIENSCR